MGCGSSTNTAVEPLTQDEVNGDEDETGSKLGSRGDSAVSKGTTDSGVVMENKEIPALPGAVPSKLPPLTSECVRESDAERIAQDASPGLLLQDATVQERQKSSEILEELLNQGIISVGQSSERSTGAGEAYSIMLDDRDVMVRKRPPARLESLKTKTEKSHPSREEIDEKIRLAEERRKLREDELKMRLRAQSARVRVRAPISSTEDDEDTSLTLVKPLQSPLTSDPTPTPPDHSQTARKEAAAGEFGSEATGDVRGCDKEKGKAEEGKGGESGGASTDNRRNGAERASEDGDEEEPTQVEELPAQQLLTSSGELEIDSSFQHAEGRDETF